MASANAFLFGSVLAIAIGPIALLILGTSAQSGLTRGLRCGLGAACADLGYALLVFEGGYAAAPWLQHHDASLHRAGGLVLVALAVHMMRNTLRAKANTNTPPATLSRPWCSTFLLTLSNPLTIIAFSGLAAQLPLGGSWLSAAWFALCLFAGSLASQSALALGGAALGHALQAPGRRALVNLASATGILLFGLMGLFGKTST